MKVCLLALACVLQAQNTPDSTQPKSADAPVAAKITLRGTDAYYLFSPLPDPKQPAPILFVLPEQPADPKQQPGLAEWQRWYPLTSARQWRLIVPLVIVANDLGPLLLQAVRDDAERRMQIDPERVYLAGQGLAVPGVFYCVSRVPHLWSAAAALDGDAKIAIDSDRLYASNSQLVPMLWTFSEGQRRTAQRAKEKLMAATWNFTMPEAAGLSEAVEFLAKQRRARFPARVDCETGSTAFGRCYWIEVTKFNGRKRNDAIRTTRIDADVTASLELGAFGYKLDDGKKGVEVESLPPDYKGPLELKDRIVSIGGRPIANGKDFADFMSQEKRERPVGVIVDRGTGKSADRIRLQSVIRLPDRPESLTARIQAERVEAGKEISIVSRAVEELKVTIPEMWVPAPIVWNGQQMTTAEVAGCYLLTEGTPGLAKRCDTASSKPAQ